MMMMMMMVNIHIWSGQWRLSSLSNVYHFVKNLHRSSFIDNQCLTCNTSLHMRMRMTKHENNFRGSLSSLILTFINGDNGQLQ